MPDLRLITPPDREPLLRALRGRIRDVVPGWRPLAEALLAEGSRVDFVGLEPSGRVVVVLVGEAGEDLELVSRGLAQAAWVKARLADWLQLAPELPIKSHHGVRVQLLCTAFRPEARAAARAIGASRMGLASYRWVQNGSEMAPLVEILLEDPEETDSDPDGPESREEVAPSEAPELEAEPETAPDDATPAFRSKLDDDDLGLTPDELAEFE